MWGACCFILEVARTHASAAICSELLAAGRYILLPLPATNPPAALHSA